jgi:hypothetical protein
LIGYAFLLLAAYLTVQSLIVLAAGIVPHASALGIVWTGIAALIMFAAVGTAAATPGTGTLRRR